MNERQKANYIAMKRIRKAGEVVLDALYMMDNHYSHFGGDVWDVAKAMIEAAKQVVEDAKSNGQA